MCTLSYAAIDDGYVLLFNRDEQKSRSLARPPELQMGAENRWLAPTDTQAGGTWIFTNAHGVTAALLNHYDIDYQPQEPKSRGLLLKQLATSSSADSLFETLEHIDLCPYPPFDIVACDLAHPLARSRWDGREIEHVPDIRDQLPISSSSFESQRIIAARKQLYEKLLGASPSIEQLEAYHQSYTPENGAASVSMLRDDAETVSLTRVDVTSKVSTMRYQPKTLGTHTFEEPIISELPRISESA